ncbi:MAG: tRNA (adenosine(37)-N6)-threonylcarbamoyltransferase complex dimerization subunit type 1 TsaB [Crocinitomicaceae bacterium]
MRFLSELILHIETATKICSVALSDGGKCLDVIEKHPSEYVHGEYLTLFIEDLMLNCRKSLNDLDAISVSIGPGSYTGLRIGLSVAKGLCFGLEIPLITVGTLDSLLSLAKYKYPNSVLCACIDARRLEVYSKILSSNRSCLSDAKATVIDENTFADFDPFVYFGDGALKLKSLWANRNLTFDSELKLSASGQVEEAIHKYRNKVFSDLAYIKPIYLKEFKAG